MPWWIVAGGIATVVAMAGAWLSPSQPTVSARPEPARVTQPTQPAPGTVISPSRDARPADTASTKLVVKCVEGGRVTYSEAGGCRGRSTELALAGTPLVGTVGVTDYEQYLLESADTRARAVERSGRTAPAVIGHTAGGSARCSYLEQQVRRLDAAARQPLPMAEQDRIRAARQAVTTQQFSLGC